MIEVEKKFRATAEQRERLVANATFLFEKENVDIFFDLPDYALSKKWSWLRERNGRMELKVAAHMPQNGELCEFFHEYETDEEIREQLALPASTAPLLDEIITLGYHPFAALHTKRKTYRENSSLISITQLAPTLNTTSLKLNCSSKNPKIWNAPRRKLQRSRSPKVCR